MLRYDTVYLCALKSQLNLAHGEETKKLGKNTKQKPSSSKETVRATVRESSPGGKSETTGGKGSYG